MPIIETKYLSYTYSKDTPFQKNALQDINFSVEKGEFIGIIGHTGSGKSTLLQHLNGLMKPQSGNVFLDGKDIWSEPKKIRDVRFKVGLVFQYPEHQLFEETVYKDISFGPANMKITGSELDLRVREAAEFTGLSEELLQKSPFSLSGGEKRRTAIAGVISMRPQVLILDEPTAGLDPVGRDEILGQIKQYQKTSGATIILVSHSMDDIAKYADRVMVMNKGKLVMFDTTENIFRNASELKKIGLEIPVVTRIFLRLSELGMPVRSNTYTLEQGLNEIKKLFGGGGANA